MIGFDMEAGGELPKSWVILGTTSQDFCQPPQCVSYYYYYIYFIYIYKKYIRYLGNLGTPPILRGRGGRIIRERPLPFPSSQDFITACTILDYFVTEQRLLCQRMNVFGWVLTHYAAPSTLPPAVNFTFGYPAAAFASSVLL